MYKKVESVGKSWSWQQCDKPELAKRDRCDELFSKQFLKLAMGIGRGGASPPGF